MESVDKRVDVRLVTHWENCGKRLGAQALIARPNFHSISIFKDDLVAIQLTRLKIKYDKPIYVGFTVLELSKELMYEFHYEKMFPLYGDRVELLYMDTDSFIYNIHTEDVYEDMKANIDWYDTSDYAPDNPYKMPLVNKKVLGKMKDELRGRLACEFNGVCAKTYSIAIDGEEEIKKAKGVKKCVIKNQISMRDYRECVLNKRALMRTMYTFCSQKHQLVTRKKHMIALSARDDKRFQIPGSTKTLPWGHYKISQLKCDATPDT